MYISEIRILGYRNFKEAVIPFHEGINMIIGPNNSGKSNLLNAIALTLNVEGHKRIGIYDLFHETEIETLRESSPRVEIVVVIKQSANELDDSEGAGILATALSNIQSPYEAQLHFQFALSSEKEVNYKESDSTLDDHSEIWAVIERDFARFYEISRWGGDIKANDQLRGLFERFDIQFLGAIRDVGRDMYMGYNTMLKEVLDYFIDYDLKSDSNKSEEQRGQEIKARNDNFKEMANPLMSDISERLRSGKEIVLGYASEINAEFDREKIDFSGHLSETELFAVLKLILRDEASKVEIPATLNGLGYNNLIYISLLLAKMQIAADSNYMSRESKLYSLLLIEEPEAHLHPSMQYQFLSFLKTNQNKRRIQQTIVTTHSTQMLSAARLDDLICLQPMEYGKVCIGYPRRIFGNTEESRRAKSYIQRFLDATRADIFYANKLIFVEGMAEVILLPIFAKYLGFDLARQHVLVVNMGGRFFDHVLKLFDTQSEWSIHKRVACITDVDPCVQIGNERPRRCYPFEYGTDPEASYSRNDSNVATCANIQFFWQNSPYAKTLEYDIAFVNSQCCLLLTQSVSNKDELNALMNAKSVDEMKGILRDNVEDSRIKNAIDGSTWNDDNKMKSIIAARYLNSISKGVNAMELSEALERNFVLEDGEPQKVQFQVPDSLLSGEILP